MNSLVIAGNFIKRFIGKKKSIVIFFIFPALLVGLIMSPLLTVGAQKQTHVAYVNLDQGQLSQTLLDKLSERYELTAFTSVDEMNQSIIQNQYFVGLTIPANYSEGLWNGHPSSVELHEFIVSEDSAYVNHTLQNEIQSMQTIIFSAKTAGFSGAALQDHVMQILAVKEHHGVSVDTIDYELDIGQSFRVAMGIILMFMLLNVSTSVSMILEDRQLNTMSRMYSAPVHIFEISVGNFLGSFIIGTLQVTPILIMIHYLLGLQLRIAFLPHFAIMEMFLLVAIGIGTAIGSIVKNQKQLSIYISLIIFPTCMLGGCFWPTWIMEDYMQKLSNFIPQTWALDAMEKLAKGAELGQVMLHIGVLALFAVVLLGIGSALLKPTEREAA